MNIKELNPTTGENSIKTNFESLKFSYNWNNKLYCKVFTTIRLPQEKFRVGNTLSVVLKNDYAGDCEVLSVTKFKLNDLTNGMALIDTGYSKQECIKVISSMYPRIYKLDNNMVMVLVFLHWLQYPWLSDKYQEGFNNEKFGVK